VARHIRNPKIESRAARAKLRPSGRPTYFDLGGKLHLGYRRGKGAGRWVMRVYIGGEKYVTDTIAEADDLADANGVTVLNFGQAQDRARARMKALDDEARIKSLGSVVTVGDAINDYLAMRLMREAPHGARSKLTKHLLGADKALSGKPLAALTADDLTKWRRRLGEQMAEASVRRVCNDFKACLNSAGRRLRNTLPPTFRDTVRDGLAFPRGSTAASERKPQVLTDADVRRLIDAAREIDSAEGWGGDLYRMVLTLAATGARFSQIARVRVVDLQVEQQRLMAPTSRKGSGAKRAPIAIQLGDDVVETLRLATVGRIGTEPLLLRPRWRREPGQKLGVLKIYTRGPWRAAGELTIAWRRIVERAGLPKEVVPYALRHSSVVRGLREGLPTRLVAATHDTSSAMIEKHYAAFISDALSELSRRAIVQLVTPPATPFPHLYKGGPG